jgi:hypothetical protein
MRTTAWGYVPAVPTLAALVVAFVCLALAQPAAASVTLGALDPDPPGPTTGRPPAPDGSDYHGCDPVGGLFVPSQGSGGSTSATPRPDTVIPAGGGVLTSWTVADEPAGNFFRLAVTRFTPDGMVIVARSASETIPETNAKVTFATHIPASAGDQIALDWVGHSDASQPAEDCFWWTGDTNDFVYTFGDYFQDGQQAPWMSGYGYGSRRVNLQATLDTGNAGSGNEASQTDGPTSAQTATPPDNAGSPPGGTGSAPHQRCVVPKLRGLRVMGAKRRLRSHHCRLGVVHLRRSGRRTGTGRRRVTSQWPRAGAVRTAGAPVSLWLAQRRRP